MRGSEKRARFGARRLPVQVRQHWSIAPRRSRLPASPPTEPAMSEVDRLIEETRATRAQLTVLAGQIERLVSTMEQMLDALRREVHRAETRRNLGR